MAFTVSVSGNSGTPRGTIAFTDNGSTIPGCGAVSMSGGEASCAIALAAGAHAIRGNYSGDSTYGAGVMGPVTLNVASASSGAAAGIAKSGINVQGLWWQPSEAGWGVNFSEQGDSLFATWFTYDGQGRGQWLVMSGGQRTGENAYSGALYRTTGPAYDSPSFEASRVQYTQVGTAYFSFSDSDNGTFVATVNGTTTSKAIRRFIFASAIPTCTRGAAGSYTTNFQDLWWRTGGSESGWGLNIAHQGSTLFAMLFTYDTDGNPMWIEGSKLEQVGDGTFSGEIDIVSGPTSVASFDPSKVARAPVGTMTLAFTGPSDGIVTFTMNGTTVTKPITRFVYSSPVTTCY